MIVFIHVYEAHYNPTGLDNIGVIEARDRREAFKEAAHMAYDLISGSQNPKAMRWSIFKICDDYVGCGLAVLNGILAEVGTEEFVMDFCEVLPDYF